jgi:predicted ATPase
MKKTCWYVITGAPCAGKTSVIRCLAASGYAVVHETARAYIEEGLAAGRTLAQIREDELAFERVILRRKIALEAGLDPRHTLFFDRGIPDSIAYFRNAGLDTAECFAAAARLRYAGVFVLARLKLKDDPVRAEDDLGAARLEALIEAAYRQLGYRPVRIPLRPVEERTALILSQIEAGQEPLHL